MADNQDPNAFESANFTIMGMAFSLKVRKKEVNSLMQAVRDLQERSSALLRSNPNLTPPQAAVLIALNVQTDLNEILSNNTPFQDRAFDLVHKSRRLLNQGLHGSGNDKQSSEKFNSPL